MILKRQIQVNKQKQNEYVRITKVARPVASTWYASLAIDAPPAM